jgi:hypothetical protein
MFSTDGNLSWVFSICDWLNLWTRTCGYGQLYFLLTELDHRIFLVYSLHFCQCLRCANFEVGQATAWTSRADQFLKAGALQRGPRWEGWWSPRAGGPLGLGTAQTRWSHLDAGSARAPGPGMWVRLRMCLISLCSPAGPWGAGPASLS